MLFASLALLFSPQADAGERVVFSAVTAAGRPIAGVKVYVRDLVGTTDAKGKTKPITFEDISGFVPDSIAVAPDGRLAIGWETRRLVFGPTADLVLRVVDLRGRPVPDQEVTIFPTQNTPPLETTGFISPERGSAPALEPRFTRTTDANGRVVFPKLPRRVAFRITTDVGFDDPMHLGGAVRPGPVAKVVLARNLELTGIVTRGATGAPLAGVKVNLWDTGHGHMSGYPGTILKTAVTNSSGRYRFTELPNCAFDLAPEQLHETVGSPYALASKVGTAPWIDKGQRPASYREGTLSWNRSTLITLERPVTSCDFRAYRAAMVTVEILNPRRASLKGYYLFASTPGGGSSGTSLDYRTGPRVFALTPGRHQIVLKDPRQRKHILKRIEVKDGGSQKYQFTLPPPKGGK